MDELIICEGCGGRILPGQLRYVLRIEVYADYEELEINEDDLKRDDRAEIEACLDDLSNLDPDELQDQVYKSFDFILCRNCQRKYIENPLHPLTGAMDDTLIH